MTAHPYRIEVDAPSGHLAITVDRDTAEAVRTTILATLLELASVDQNAPVDEVCVDEPVVAPTTPQTTVATSDDDTTQDEPTFHLTRNNPDSALQRNIQGFLAREMPTASLAAVTEHEMTDRFNATHVDDPVSVASIKVAMRHLMMRGRVQRERRSTHGYHYWMPNRSTGTSASNVTPWRPSVTMVAGEGVVAGSLR